MKFQRRVAILVGFVGVGCAASTAVAPSTARAFGDAELFGETTLLGGGAGRYYTGSPADPYNCAVCHERGRAPEAQVAGLPLTGYRAGTAYEITVDWSDALSKVSAAVEITDMLGRRAGALRLPSQDEQQDPELCDEPAELAGKLITFAPEPGASCRDESGELYDDCRQVIYARSCGAQRLRFLWTAPRRAVGKLWFAGSVVSTDGDGTPAADGVLDISTAIATTSGDRDLTTSANCSTAPTPPASRASGMAMLVACGCLQLLRAYRRAKR